MVRHHSICFPFWAAIAFHVSCPRKTEHFHQIIIIIIVSETPRTMISERIYKSGLQEQSPCTPRPRHPPYTTHRRLAKRTAKCDQDARLEICSSSEGPFLTLSTVGTRSCGLGDHGGRIQSHRERVRDCEKGIRNKVAPQKNSAPIVMAFAIHPWPTIANSSTNCVQYHSNK
ncbi:hypothetical protein SCHPADRAFT_467091 [Schizopora paradoxa]|uniref:Uncharacterized protein n=1 Tax=Schizopora paradoxa TaxID=27342 RepID=A0A0H2RHV9_9AGAM|nr:hypothetical protein SCHPADRAFT_467091 [Schizopora paradoxa]